MTGKVRKVEEGRDVDGLEDIEDGEVSHSGKEGSESEIVVSEWTKSNICVGSEWMS